MSDKAITNQPRIDIFHPYTGTRKNVQRFLTKFGQDRYKIENSTTSRITTLLFYNRISNEPMMNAE